MPDSESEAGITESLAGAKGRLLQKYLRGEIAMRSAVSTIPRRESHQRIPLSYEQEQIWLHAQMAPELPLYNVTKAVRVHGPLQVSALREALNAIVSRHEALRTLIVADGARPEQLVAEPRPVEMPMLDVTVLPPLERESALQHALNGEARRPFDLTADLMLRALLVRTSEREHALLLTMHHLAADGWSMGVLARELSTLYAAAAEGRPPALPPLPVQYGDYALWQRHRDLANQLAYWKTRLAGAPSALGLPFDHPRPAVRSYRGAMESAVFPVDLAYELRKLSLLENATLFMTLLAAFQTLLHRYAGDDDVLVASPIAGRSRVETEPLIGFFVNTLVLRADLSGDPPFRELLSRVRATALGAYAHPDLPFARLIEELRPERDPKSTPLVQAMFALQEAVPEPRFPGLTVSPLELHTGTAKFDLTASALETPQGLRVDLEYNTDLYTSETIRRMLGHYETLLQGIVANPEQRLSQLPLLTGAERHKLVVAPNATGVPFPQTDSIASLFEAQVARTPESVAVIWEGESLTYQDLNRRANQLAHYLRRLGVGPEVAVGIYLEPSVQLVIGMLGILKAGGVYVPMDPSYPKARLAFMQEDAELAALVTLQALTVQLPMTTVPIVPLDALPADGERVDDPPHQTTGEHLAYLMYTSGSTGQPKAVAVPQRAITRLVMSTDYVTITALDVMAQASNAAFDAATFEIWGALLNGAKLVIVPRDTVLSPKALSEALDRHGITILFLTTALFNQIAREQPSALRRLHTVLFGGETAEPRWVAEVLQHGAPERLLHVYGPTETTTFACWYRVQHVPAEATSIPIGGPISNTQAYVLDRHLQPVPVGVPGELHIGGPGVARGYHRRADLTAEKFIPDPFSGMAARLYKTGDLVRYCADGTLDFLGRIDQQVKIRGHRIEPGEIETTLRGHPAVHEAVVVPWEDGPGNKHLVAYVVLSQKGAATSAGLRQFLRERLPAYMLPAHFIPLDALPLTPNGKVDRARLPLPATWPDGDRDRVQPDRPPRDALERFLVQAWEKTLGVRSIGPRDNFFDLGGHSLLAAGLVAHIEKAVGRKVPLSVLFQAPTIERLASILRRDAVNVRDSLVVSEDVGGPNAPLFCIRCPEEFVRRLRDHLGPNQPCYVLAPHGFDGRRAPSTVEQMAADYIAEIRSLQPKGPYYLTGFSFGGMAAFEVAQQLRKHGLEVGLLMLLDPTPLAEERSTPRIHQRTAAFRARFGAVRDSLRRHWLRLRSLPPTQRLVYTAGRFAATGMRSIDRSLGSRCKRLICNGYLKAGRPIPPSLRRFYFVEASLHAARMYRPRTYPGRAVLFVTDRDSVDRQRAWAALAADGMDTYVFQTDHFGILTEPHVEILAQRLTAFFRGTQTETGDKTADGATPTVGRN